MMLTWKVKNFDMNSQLIRDYDVLKYREEDIKKLKKKCANKQEFSEELEYDLRRQFWSRSEYELIIELVGDRVLLKPWSGCREPMKAAIDVTDDSTFDWRSFADHHIDRQSCGDRAIIDIWEQCVWCWKELVDYCWYTHLPYERDHEKFHK